MTSYQHLFSTNAVLNVWRNLRNNRPGDPNDLLLTLQYQPDEVRSRRFEKGSGHGTGHGTGHGDDMETTTAVDGGHGMGGGQGRSIGFVVPWRSMQAQKRELREREKELAEALVVLAGEVAFTDLSSTLQSSLSSSPLIQIRHMCAGLSRQISKVELQMVDNAPFSHRKNLFTGGEIARKFLPPIERLFEQRPVPQRMIFELLMELKDVVYMGMQDCDAETGEWELEGWNTFEELDNLVVRCLVRLTSKESQSLRRFERCRSQLQLQNENNTAGKKFLKRKPSTLVQPSQDLQAQAQVQRGKGEDGMEVGSWTQRTSATDLLYALESLETTATAMSHLTPSIPDFLAASSLTLRRMLDRRTLNDFALSKKKRSQRCAEYARCMKWAGGNWRQGGGCRRGCANEDEDPEGLPSWHSASRWFEKEGLGGRGGFVLGEQTKDALEE